VADLYPLFEQCIAFGHMRYRHKALGVGNEKIGMMYDVLRFSRPPLIFMRELRDMCRRTLDTPVPALVDIAGAEIDQVRYPLHPCW